MPDEPARLEMWADIACPYAYLAAWRLRKVLPEFEGRVEVVHRSLAIEHVDEKVTPKDVIDAETPFIMLEAPGIPYAPWPGPTWAYPATMWPAFEAVKVAQRQDWRLAHEMDWRLREAFFHRGRCISMRHVVLEEARAVHGLDFERFREAWDAGEAKREVLDEAVLGWDTMDLELSPTFVLPDGTRHVNPSAPVVRLDKERDMKVVRVDPPSAKGEAALDVYRAMLRDALT